MNFYESNKTEYLNTIEKWDLMELLDSLGDRSNILAVIAVRPRHAHTGLLEERGLWIHKLWNIVLSRMPGVAGHRMAWSELLFVCEGVDIRAEEKQFAGILSYLKEEKLKSLCVLSMVSGRAKVKFAEADRMFEGLSKEKNFGDPARSERWLLDGERYIASSSPRNS